MCSIYLLYSFCYFFFWFSCIFLKERKRQTNKDVSKKCLKAKNKQINKTNKNKNEIYKNKIKINFSRDQGLWPTCAIKQLSDTRKSCIVTLKLSGTNILIHESLASSPLGLIQIGLVWNNLGQQIVQHLQFELLFNKKDNWWVY